MLLIPLDLEDDRPSFIEDPTFNVIPDIEDLLDETVFSDFSEFYVDSCQKEYVDNISPFKRLF